jgi:uncharacterized protein YjiK
MQHTISRLIIAGLFMLLFSRCHEDTKAKYESPEGYDFSKPWILKLPIELDEISGLAYYAKDTSVFAINDEFGWLYKIHLPGRHHIRKWKFSGAGDYEEILMIDTIFYALQSNGHIEVFTFGPDHNVLKADAIFPSKGNEFESLYYDSAAHKIALVCKDCDVDKKPTVTKYFFDPVTKQYLDSTETIDVQKIAIMLGEKSLKFKPSASAVHPVTKELYLISAVNSLLVITDGKGEPRIAYRLDEKLFKQPEGLTFTPAGDLVISNEAADKGVANILLFKYHKKR